MSAVLPASSVTRLVVKSVPVTVTLTPGIGADSRAAKVWMRKIPVAIGLMLLYIWYGLPQHMQTGPAG